MIHTHRLLRSHLLALTLAGVAGLAMAKHVPGDAALPVVELMPLAVKHEADLQLSAEQLKSLADFRAQAMPKRIRMQQNILQLRGQLRMAILENRPQAEREALWQQITEVETQHTLLRIRCVELMRQVLSAAQFAQLKRLYLDGLR